MPHAAPVTRRVRLLRVVALVIEIMAGASQAGTG
jgi:hypothetical protein